MLSTEIYCYTAGGNVVGTSSHLPVHRVKVKANFTVRLLHLTCIWRIVTDWTPAYEEVAFMIRSRFVTKIDLR